MDYAGLPELRGAKPTFVMAAITYLEDELLQPGWRAFEWGSGGSTLWLSQWCKSVVSIEHEPAWYERALAELNIYDIFNVDVVYLDLKEYAEHILHLPPDTFDLIFVDGRERGECIKHATGRLRPGGVLVLDDSERAQYQPAIDKHLTNWPRRDFTSQAGPAKMTSIWIKPYDLHAARRQ